MKHNGVEIVTVPSMKLIIEGTEQTSFFIDPPYLSGMEMGEQNRGAREKFDTIEAFYERLLVFLSGNYPDNKKGLIHCFVNNRYFKPGHVTPQLILDMQQVYQNRQDERGGIKDYVFNKD